MTNSALLSRARSHLAEKKAANEAMYAARLTEIYELIPETRDIDRRLAALMRSALGASLSGETNTREALDSAKEAALELMARRAELLTARGLAADYTDERPMCPRCRDTGYVGTRVCACLRELYNEEARRGLSSLLRLGGESFERFDLRYYSAAPDPDTGVSSRECMETVLETCRAFAQGFGKSSVNLLFQGGVGLGKTFLSACIARVVSEKGFSVVYETAVEALRAFESQQFRRASQDSDDVDESVSRLLECELLIFDDLGTEMTTAFTQSALYTLVNTRLISGRKTIITTNLTDEELSRRYTKQLVSRLMGEYLNLSFAGSDIRAIKKARGLE